MVDKRCPYCGTILIIVNGGCLYCPNHGVITPEEMRPEMDDPSCKDG